MSTHRPEPPRPIVGQAARSPMLVGSFATGDAGQVTLLLPPSSEFVPLARLVAESIGNTAGFGSNDIQGLLSAVDEACGLIIDHRPRSALGLTFGPMRGRELDVEVSSARAVDHSAPVGYGVDVLNATTQQWSWGDDGERIVVRFVISEAAQCPR